MWAFGEIDGKEPSRIAVAFFRLLRVGAAMRNSPDKTHVSWGAGGVCVISVVRLRTVVVGIGWVLYVVCLLSRYEFCQDHLETG